MSEGRIEGRMDEWMMGWEGGGVKVPQREGKILKYLSDHQIDMFKLLGCHVGSSLISHVTTCSSLTFTRPLQIRPSFNIIIIVNNMNIIININIIIIHII